MQIFMTSHSFYYKMLDLSKFSFSYERGSAAPLAFAIYVLAIHNVERAAGRIVVLFMDPPRRG